MGNLQSEKFHSQSFNVLLKVLFSLAFIVSPRLRLFKRYLVLIQQYSGLHFCERF